MTSQPEARGKRESGPIWLAPLQVITESDADSPEELPTMDSSLQKCARVPRGAARIPPPNIWACCLRADACVKAKRAAGRRACRRHPRYARRSLRGLSVQVARAVEVVIPATRVSSPGGKIGASE